MTPQRIDDVTEAFYEALSEDDDRFERPWTYAGMAPRNWISENWRRFLIPIEAIVASRMPVADAAQFEADRELTRNYIYFLMDCDRIGYVGQTCDLFCRMEMHTVNFSNLSHVALIRVPQLFLNSIEGFYIGLLRPTLVNVRVPIVREPFDRLLKLALAGKLFP